MTTTNLELQALTELGQKAEKAKAKKATQVWNPPDLKHLRPGTYVACDQSISACGLVKLWIRPGSLEVNVMQATTLKTEETNVKGFEDLYQRTNRLQGLIKSVTWGWITSEWEEPPWYVHEAPPVGGGRMIRPEVSIITGYAFRAAVGWNRLLPMVRRQDHYKFICGNANASKPECHQVLKSYLPQINGSELITNEATRDALQIALYAAQR